VLLASIVVQLMAELTSQYEKLRTTGLVLDEKNMPIVGGHKADTARHNPESLHEARRRALAAAEERSRIGKVTGGGGRLGGSNASWQNAPPSEMAARAAEARQRQWDAEHGLEAAELEAMTQGADGDGDDSDDDVVEVHEPPRGSSSLQAAPAAASASTSSQAPQAITWGAPGQGTWQKVPCPVCGPVCKPSLHAEGDPPPQDADEGGGPTESSDAPRGMRGETRRRGAAPVVDLTASDDEGGLGGLEGASSEPAAIGSSPPRRESKRPRTRPLAQGSGLARGSWMCARCTFANDAWSAPCEMGCGQSAPGFWACPKCTLRNEKSSSGCVACGTWRYSRA
jgi:hypothetical protein